MRIAYREQEIYFLRGDDRVQSAIQLSTRAQLTKDEQPRRMGGDVLRNRICRSRAYLRRGTRSDVGNLAWRGHVRPQEQQHGRTVPPDSARTNRSLGGGNS